MWLEEGEDFENLKLNSNKMPIKFLVKRGGGITIKKIETLEKTRSSHFSEVHLWLFLKCAPHPFPHMLCDQREFVCVCRTKENKVYLPILVIYMNCVLKTASCWLLMNMPGIERQGERGERERERQRKRDKYNPCDLLAKNCW